MSDPVHLMTIEMGAWCGASGPGHGRASSAWREVTCTECLAKRVTWLLALVWDMLQAMPASHAALSFAVRAGRLGVTDEHGRPLAMACTADDAFAERRRDAIAAQEPQTAPGTLALQLIIAVDALRDIADEPHVGYGPVRATKALDDIGTPGFGEPQPAPELAAAMRETASRELTAAMAESRGYRAALEQVAKHHDDAIAQVRTIARIAKRALEGK